MAFILTAIGIWLAFYIPIYVIGHFWIWMSNGFNLGKTREDLEFMKEMAQERRAQEKRANEKAQAEYRAKRMERLGY